MPQQPLSATEIGARVRLARERLGRSQEDVARQLGISQNSVQKIENGKVGRSRYVSVLWELVGLDLAELNPAFKPNLPPRPPAIGFAGSPVVVKRMTEAQREAELVRSGYELGRRMERLTKTKEIELAILEPQNGNEFEVGMTLIRLDDSPVPFAVPLEVAQSLSGLLPRLIEQIEALKRQTNRRE